MDLPLGVLAVYGALVVWAALLIRSVKQGSYRPFLLFGIGLMVWLNLGYFVNGISSSIASFIGIYDLLDNVGLSGSETPAAMAACADNACSVWGDRFNAHPAWGVAFFERFTDGPQLRRNLLYGHIAFNSIAFILMHVQLFRPGTGTNRARHAVIGRIMFGMLTISLICAVWLSTEHGTVSAYGGNLSMVGFWSMSAFVYGCAIMTIAAVRRGDVAGHRRWSIRFAGSMWGSFWLFRVMLFVLDPLLRNFETASILIPIWFSAPLGIAIAELYRRRSNGRPATEPSPAPDLIVTG